MDQSPALNINLLSQTGSECLKAEKKEVSNFKNLALIKEIEFTEAKKLAVFSGEVMSGLEVYTNEKSSSEEKIKALEAIKRAYTGLVPYVRKFHKKCFEPRMVLLMCEVRMILAGILPTKIREVEAGIESNENSENNKNSKTSKVNPAILGS